MKKDFCGRNLPLDLKEQLIRWYVLSVLLWSGEMDAGRNPYEEIGGIRILDIS